MYEYKLLRMGATPFKAIRTAYLSNEAQRAFIKRVYVILSLQCLFTSGFATLFFLLDAFHTHKSDKPLLSYVATGVVGITLMVLFCCPLVRYKPPFNYALLVLFTLAETYLLGMYAGVYISSSVFITLIITIALWLLATAIAVVVKIDFTAGYSILLFFVWVFAIFGILSLFFPIDFSFTILSSMGTVIFSLSLIADTQLSSGKFKHSISTKEYIFFSIKMYVDILMLICCILYLIGET